MIYFHFNRHCLFILLAFVGSYYRVCRRILAERRSGGLFSSFEVIIVLDICQEYSSKYLHAVVVG